MGPNYFSDGILRDIFDFITKPLQNLIHKGVVDSLHPRVPWYKSWVNICLLIFGIMFLAYVIWVLTNI